MTASGVVQSRGHAYRVAKWFANGVLFNLGSSFGRSSEVNLLVPAALLTRPGFASIFIEIYDEEEDWIIARSNHGFAMTSLKPME